MKRNINIIGRAYWTLLLVIALKALAPISTAHAAPDRDAKNSIFFEFGGPGLVYTLNYERLLWGGLGVRAGFSYLQGRASAEVQGLAVGGRGKLWTIPIMVDYIGISTGNHSLELGAGLTIMNVEGTFDVERVDLLGTQGRTTYGNFVVGYRIQPPDGGFQFRIGYSPIYGHGIYQHWAYLSLGGSF